MSSLLEASLRRIPVGGRRYDNKNPLDPYRALVGDKLIEEITSEASNLKGARICHINSTPYGGGVTELLSREVPLLRSLGLNVDWFVIQGSPEVFEITKQLHNALQGAPNAPSEDSMKIYARCNEQCAKTLSDNYDVIVVHDPQPAALKEFSRITNAKWIWRCHIDTSSSNPEAWDFLRDFLQGYDAIVFTMREFLPGELEDVHLVQFIPPAIDPLGTKNMEIPFEIAKAAIADSGVDIQRPLMVQVSRFDPWKDPLGVISCYRLVKKELPEVQLALIGSLAGDDPEGWRMLSTINKEAENDDDLHVFTNMMGYGNAEVNMFQRGCDLVIQKSIKEGFGLVVSEALWKEKAVVAGRAGGIPMQFPEGYENYLVESIEECAAKCVYLLHHPGEKAKFGREGKQHVRENFLLPRLVRDDIKLLRKVLKT